MKIGLIILFTINAVIGLLNSIDSYRDDNMDACRGWGCAAAFSVLLLINKIFESNSN